ncbi:hypothetical protein [Micromonospora okii]|uniref:hypothetical protein n=1 Tax=Micromonospora okii TaxID=1182970 RepID=UPI001E329E42|nr:hypothetical protein [Micromonospora okii]
MSRVQQFRVYWDTYSPKVDKFRDLRIARRWMESGVPAPEAAAWANLGFLPEEAAPLIADGITADTVEETERHAAQAVGGPEALAALRVAELTGTGALVGPDDLIRVVDPLDPTREIITVRPTD